MTTLTRRAILTTAAGGAAAGVIAAAAPPRPVAARTQDAAALQGAGFYRFAFGTKQLTVLADGASVLPGRDIFAINTDPAVFRAAQEAEFQPADSVNIAMNALLVEEGGRRILIDAGAGAFVGPDFGRLSIALSNAGIAPESIDTVVVTHGHFDHFGGISTAQGAPRFPNAQIVWRGAEHAYWSSERAIADVQASPLPDQFKEVSIGALRTALPATLGQTEFVDGEVDIAPGVRFTPAPGHTPHSSVVFIESEGAQLLYASDTTLLPVQNAKHPEWVSAFETDAEKLVATRRRLLDQAAADKILWFAYHASFPALGRIRPAGGAWDYVPERWVWS